MKLFARICVLVIVSTLFFVHPVYATRDRQEKIHVVVEKNEVINKDYFVAGDTVRILGTINGDAYIAGGTVTIDGTVNGDVFIAGGTIHINGSIKNDIRAIGGTIHLSHTVGGNITLAGGTIMISPDARISGSILVGAGDLGIYGPIGKGITAGVGTLTINTSVGGDLLAGVGELNLQPKTKINGSVTYWAENEANITDKRAVSGELIYYPMPKHEAQKAHMASGDIKAMATIFTGVAVIMTLVHIATMFILGLILMALLPNFTQRTIAGMKKNPWGSFGLGLITTLVFPILAITAMMTVVGIPIGIFFIMTLVFLCAIGNIYAAIYIGHSVCTLLKADVHKAWQLLVGLVLFGILTMIPMLGWLIKGIFSLIGIGAVLFEKQTIYKQMRAKHIV